MSNTEYREYSDEELILRFRDGEEAVMGYLMEKYKNLVRSKAKAMFLIGGETEDLIQEGMIGLFQAIQNYDYGRDASFFTFADLCITRKIFSAVKASQGQKHIPLNSYISTYSSFMDEEGEAGGEQGVLDNLPVEDADTDPEARVLSNETMEYLEKAIRQELSDFEREAFELYMTGATSGSVAKILGKSPKATDNAIQRARHKLKELFEKNKFYC